MKGEGKSSRRLTQGDAAGGETSVCVVPGLLYPQGESGAAATEKTRVLRVGCRAGIKIARGGRFVPSSPCYRLKLTGPLRPVHISIPALRAEGDFFEPDGQGQTFIPAFTQRVTGLAVPFVQGQQISTHTLRVEGDCPLPSTTSTRWTSFYPRPPHGGRQSDRLKVGDSLIFISTPSAWRATSCLDGCLRVGRISIHALRDESVVVGISIHALRMEGDISSPHVSGRQKNFYPRPRVEGNRGDCVAIGDRPDFYPPPRVEGDPKQRQLEQRLLISTHALA